MKILKKIIIIIFIITISLKPMFSQTISIAAAADLRFAMNELIFEFNKSYPKIKVNVIYGSSGNLYQQIVNKAPFDIFFSADLLFTYKLDSMKLTSGKPKIYAIGHLVLWSTKLDVSKGINILNNENIKRVAIANPAVAPYGKRAVECLKYYNLYKKTEEKLVKGENVSQAAQFILTGNADIGIIALSLASSPEMKKRGKYYLIDEKSYSPPEQAYVITKRAQNNEFVQKFVHFIELPQAKAIFTKYGFK